MNLTAQDVLFICKTSAAKTKNPAEYKSFLKKMTILYGIEKNDLFQMLSLCKKKDVMDALTLIAKYEKRSK